MRENERRGYMFSASKNTDTKYTHTRREYVDNNNVNVILLKIKLHVLNSKHASMLMLWFMF